MQPALIYDITQDPTTMKISFVGYFTFYNKNELHYKVKDHSLLDMTNTDLLMVYVYFLFSLYIKVNLPQVRDRRDQVDIFVKYILFIFLFYLMTT